MGCCGQSVYARVSHGHLFSSCSDLTTFVDETRETAPSHKPKEKEVNRKNCQSEEDTLYCSSVVSGHDSNLALLRVVSLFT